MAQTKPWDHSMKFGGRNGAHQTLILTSEEARQGVISGHVIVILVVSLMLAVIAGATIYVALV
jgi:hypothetical protein